jgi:formiminotetrahydrofolate cyclodeaminase
MQACEIPLEISEICLNILNIAQDCYKIWNPNVLTDVLVWINLTKAAAKSALEPIESNLKSIKDNHYVENTISRKNKILAEIDKFII